MQFLGRWVVGALLALVAAGGAAGHERPHERPVATGPIDPSQSFPFLAVSGAGGHFHALLLLPDLKTFFVATHLGLFRSEDDGSKDDVYALAWDSRATSCTRRRTGMDY